MFHKHAKEIVFLLYFIRSIHSKEIFPFFRLLGNPVTLILTQEEQKKQRMRLLRVLQEFTIILLDLFCGIGTW